MIFKEVPNDAKYLKTATIFFVKKKLRPAPELGQTAPGLFQTEAGNRSKAQCPASKRPKS